MNAQEAATIAYHAQMEQEQKRMDAELMQRVQDSEARRRARQNLVFVMREVVDQINQAAAKGEMCTIVRATLGGTKAYNLALGRLIDRDLSESGYALHYGYALTLGDADASQFAVAVSWEQDVGKLEEWKNQQSAHDNLCRANDDNLRGHRDV